MARDDARTRSGGGPLLPAQGPARPELPPVGPDRFAIAREHARGGLGRVLVAHDQVLDRQVAIKELLVPGAAAQSRFVREARLTARLQHPAIVPVYEAGRWPGGEPFYAMKMVGGRTLRDAIDAAPTLDGRMALLPHLITVAEAVAYAHSHGIIHRDLKPANVLVGEFGETLVADWGLAKEIGEAEGAPAGGPPGPGAGDLTVAGAVVGTAHYMPPEQARGEPAGPRADVYALGAMLYHLLAGRPPYEGNTSEVLPRVVAEPPPPLQSVEPGTPPDLAGIVARAMARDPAGRYESARELAEDLRRFSTGQLVTSHHYSPATLLWRWLKRYRLPVSLSAAFLALLGATGALSVARIERARVAAETNRNHVLLLQARTALEKDPSAAMAWLKTYPIAAGDFESARAIFEEGRGRGATAVIPGVILGTVGDAPGGGFRFVLDGGLILDFDPAAGARRSFRLESFPERAVCLAFSRGGQLLAVGERRRVVVHDLLHGTRHAFELPAAEALAHDFCVITDDGRWLAFGTTSGLALASLPGGEVRILRGEDSAGAAAASPDGKTLIWNAWPAHTVHAVDLESGRSLDWSSGAVTPGYLLDFTRDGRHAFSGTDEGHLVSWTRDGRRDRDFAVCPSVLGRAVPAGGDAVAVRCRDGDTRVLHLDGGREERLGAAGDELGWVDASSDGSLIFSGGTRTAVVWRRPSAEIARFAFDEELLDGRVSPDGRWFSGMAMSSRKALIFHLEESGDRVLEARGGARTTAQFAPDGRLVLTRSGDVAVCDPPGEACRSYPVEAPILARVSFDSRRVAFASATRSGWFDLDTGARHDAGGGVRSMAWSPRSNRIAFGDDQRVLLLVDAETGEKRVLERGAYAYSLAWTPDGRELAWRDDIGNAEVVSVDGGVARKFTADRDLRPLAVSTDGAWLLGGTPVGAVWMWDIARGTRELLQSSGGRTVIALAVSPDGRTVAAGGQDRLVRLFDLKTRSARVLPAHAGEVGLVAFSPDGRSLASADSAGQVRVWDVATGDPRLLRDHPGAVLSLSWAPSGARLVSASAGQIVVHDLARLPPPLTDPASLVAALARESSVVLGSDDRPVTPVE